MTELETTQSTRATRISDIEKSSDGGRRLVEYFVVISSVEQSESSPPPPAGEESWKTESNSYDFDEEDSFAEYKFRPTITARYPLVNHEDNPLHESVTYFCHPTGSIQLKLQPHMPKVHYFVATGGTGRRIYGTCLTLWEPYTIQGTHSREKPTESSQGDTNKSAQQQQKEVYLPKNLVVLSSYPYLAAFREFLTQLHRMTKSGDMKLPVERYIINFCKEIPAPPPGSFEVQTTVLDSVIKIWSPPHNLPIPWVSMPFSVLFECLDIDNIILVWHCLALERQVLLTSTQVSILTTVSEILLSLLFPMQWTHAYIPVVPISTIHFLSAPMPFLCGINKANLADALFDLSRECVLVDLDKNTVTLGPDTVPLPMLPPFQEAVLRAQVEDNVGMVFREARSLTRNDDFSESGSNLPSHVKMMAEAMWESKLSLYDEAFHLLFTPEEARKNLLNGNDASGMDTSDRSDNLLFTNQPGSRKQSPMDVVQEAFLGTFVYLLRNYRKYLVFPSKHNEGSYGGAGFRSKEFVESQRYDMREFLEQLIGTQMFDTFITKRLYGSGEADVTFFDMAIDRFVKNAGMFADVDLGGRLTLKKTERFYTNKNRPRPRSRPTAGTLTRMSENPLWQSAKVHRVLKTIVPPEPTAEGLPGSEKVYKYDNFPSSFDPDLFGTPRPLPAAVIAEFDRQRKDAAQFRRKMAKELKQHIHRAHSAIDQSYQVSPEVATFTVFFVAFTALVGKELMEIIYDPEAPEERQILSTYVPSASVDSFSDADVSDDDAREHLDEEEKDGVAAMKTARPMGGMFGDDDEDATGVATTVSSPTTQAESEKSSAPGADNTASINLNEENLEHSSGDSSVAKDYQENAPETSIEEHIGEEHGNPRRRFRDKLSDLQIEEAKATGRAQLGLAFEMLTMMKKRALKADPEAYQSLIDACGRIGDFKRATELLTKMHEDGIVADGTVYACLVSAFSAETAWKRGHKQEDLPEWANSTAVEVDWNKLQKRSFIDRLVEKVVDLDDDDDEEEGENDLTAMQKLKKRISKARNKDDVKAMLKKKEEARQEFFVTETVEKQIILGENLLEIVFPDISIDTEDEVCPRCNYELSDDDVVKGWKADSNDYTTSCPNCTQRFVPRFCVQSSAANFVGSKGPASPLICERLSPWVLQKEIRTVMSDDGGIDSLLDPQWREREYKNAVFWWNLVLSCMRYRLPFTFLLQGNFEQKLIPPMPEDDQ